MAPGNNGPLPLQLQPVHAGQAVRLEHLFISPFGLPELGLHDSSDGTPEHELGAARGCTASGLHAPSRALLKVFTTPTTARATNNDDKNTNDDDDNNSNILEQLQCCHQPPPPL